MHNFLHSFISFWVAIFFILLGVIGILFPWIPSIRTEVITILLEYSIAIFLFGLCFLTIGFAAFINILFSVNKHYYRFKIGTNPVEVDENLIQSYLNSYWNELFPNQTIPNRLILNKNRIHIIADLPYMQRQQQEVMLERIKHDLQKLLEDLLGYRYQFHFSASFQSENKSG